MTLRTALAALAAACLSFAPAAFAQDRYPSRQVTLVVPYPPGGSNDVFARELAKRLSDAWKVPVIIDNRPGAGGAIGAAYVTRARPDGYTLMLLSSSFTTNAAIEKNLPFDPVKGFTDIGMVAKGPMILTVRNTLPVKSFAEFLAYARAHPGQLNFASSGVGSTNHFATELLEEAADIRMTHVPYKGMAPAVTDVMAGHVDVLIASAPSIYPQVKGDRVRALGVTSAAPSPVIPGLPALAREGVPGYSFELWWGVMAPAGLPEDVVRKVNQDINAILATEDMQRIIQREGALPAPMTSAEFARTVASEIATWRRVAERANIHAE
ncbi:MAG TPA: tripartite tricarboxylate transporter substrate binding protein [Usitatibacter sp.]|jgi:tripartite-type tricarboxylate transporter receptor subunit TctC|nr:tripartite tricarboxylate transporter substrate binding protein [Usitatibacter sp.]